MIGKDAPIEVQDEIVIDGGQRRTHRAWAALEVASNGDLLVAYKDGSDHHRTPDGVLVLARSIDGGQTWEDKKPLVAEPGWDWFTNHGMTRLADDTILLHTIRRRNSTRPDGARKSFCRGSFTRSVDDGHLWQERGQEMICPFMEEWGNSCAYGKVSELEDGTLMVPFYGVPKGVQDTRLRSLAVAFSHDGGRSWPEFVSVYEDRKGDVNPSETDLIRLPDGRYLLMIRANAALRLYRSYSEDEGRTWTPIEPTDLPGQCPALIYLASGAILCAYRDMRREQPGMSCAVSPDLGETWTPLGYLYEGSNWDCAYPSMVHLLGGLIYCAFYTAAEPEASTGSCEIHGLVMRDKSAG